MTYGIRVIGLQEAQRLLKIDLGPAIKAAALATAKEIEGVIAPYPPSTIANSPSNARGRWYERGYGPRWRTKDGSIHGRKTSQMLGRRFGVMNSQPAKGEGGWAISQQGRQTILGNAATYAGRLHSQTAQVRWAGERGWITDKTAIQRVLASGAVVRIFTQAIMAAIRRGR